MTDITVDLELRRQIAEALGYSGIRIQNGELADDGGSFTFCGGGHTSESYHPNMEDDLPAAIAQCEADGLVWSIGSDGINYHASIGFGLRRGIDYHSAARALWRAWLAWKQAQREEEADRGK